MPQICHLELPSRHHLYWPELDIDLAVESLTHPERLPLYRMLQERDRALAGAFDDKQVGSF